MIERIKADQYRIKGDRHNWSITKPVKTKEGIEHRDFKWFATPEMALDKLFELLLADGLNERAAEVKALRTEIAELRVGFVQASLNAFERSPVSEEV